MCMCNVGVQVLIYMHVYMHVYVCMCVCLMCCYMEQGARATSVAVLARRVGLPQYLVDLRMSTSRTGIRYCDVMEYRMDTNAYMLLIL